MEMKFSKEDIEHIRRIVRSEIYKWKTSDLKELDKQIDKDLGTM